VAQAADERPDYDPDPTGNEPAPDGTGPVEASGFFAFPRGTGPGTCLHHIFEEIDFADEARPSRAAVVEAQLRAHSPPGEPWKAIVADAVERALHVPLAPAEPGLTLSGVTRSQRLSELEFQFPAALFSPARLRQAWGMDPGDAPFAARLERLGFKPARGF